MSLDEETQYRQKFFTKIISTFLLPYAYAKIYLEDIFGKIALLERIRIIKPLSNIDAEALLIIAIWQYGRLRPDVRNLVITAKSLGFATLVLNTGRITSEPSILEIDAYVEIPNYGRDFASYKRGFQLIYQHGLHKQFRQILIANDSIFYSTSGLQQLLSRMRRQECAVLGATENFEFERHLGSFFISFDSSVFLHKRFERYWKRFRLTNIRRKVISRGELKLSRVVKKIAGDEEVRAVFNLGEYESNLRRASLKDLDAFVEYSLSSSGLRWKRSHLVAITSEWRNRFRHELISRSKDSEIKITNSEAMVITATSVTELVRELSSNFPSIGELRVETTLKQIVIQSLMKTMSSGSQIHNSALNLFRLGLPLIKLDSIYRGTMSYSEAICYLQFVSDVEFDQLGKLLFSRAYGPENLVGWKRAAFDRGLI